MCGCIGWVLLVWLHQGLEHVLWRYSPLFSLCLQQKRNLVPFLQNATKGKYRAKELFWFFRLPTGIWWTCPHLCRRIKYQLPSPRLACGLREKPWCQLFILHRWCCLHLFPFSEWYLNRKDVKTPQQAVSSSFRRASLQDRAQLGIGWLKCVDGSTYILQKLNFLLCQCLNTLMIQMDVHWFLWMLMNLWCG